MTNVLILGSGPEVVQARDWPRGSIDVIVAINNAWRVRDDWDVQIHPWDFPTDRLPVAGPNARIVTEADFVPAQNAYGGFVYAGATMAFTAAYWALNEYEPACIAFFGCNMTYPAKGKTHFYGTGTPDPLRRDITLQSLEAKSARLRVLAAQKGTAVVNLSTQASRLMVPRARLAALPPVPVAFDATAAALAQRREAVLDYDVPSGRYWEEIERFDPAQLARLDALWLRAGALGKAAAAA